MKEIYVVVEVPEARTPNEHLGAICSRHDNSAVAMFAARDLSNAESTKAFASMTLKHALKGGAK